MTNYNFRNPWSEAEASILTGIINHGGSFETIFNRGGWSSDESGNFGYHILHRPGFAILMDSVEGVPVACLYDAAAINGSVPTDLYNDYTAPALVVSDDFDKSDWKSSNALFQFVAFNNDEFHGMGYVVENKAWDEYKPARRLSDLIEFDKQMKAEAEANDDVYQWFDNLTSL